MDGDRYATTSTTSLTIALGAQSLTVDTALAYTAAQTVLIAESGSNFMEATVTAYNPATGVLDVNVTTITGAGTFASWTVNLAGAPGPAGADGNTIVSGTAAPTTEGVDGDYYFDTDDLVWYGPKAAGTWPATGDTILGTDGLNGLDGLDGNTVLNGTVDPTTEGVDGDFYINTTTDSIFGPKTAGVWGSGTSLVGPAGPSTLQAAYDGGQTITMGSGNIDFISGAANSILYINEPNENVGIGTTSPNANFQLDVVGGDALINGATVGRGGGNIASNTALGANALANNAGSSNTAVGTSALTTNNSGTGNTALGNGALNSNSSGNNNTGVGLSSLGLNNAGADNAALGYQSLLNNNGNFNSALGAAALRGNTSGIRNVGVGIQAGDINTIGDFNTFLGANSNPSVAGLSNATAIGANTIVGASNSLVLGNNANVGIGTSTPTNKLEVIGDAAKFDSVIIVNGAQAGYVLTSSDATGAASWQPGASAPTLQSAYDGGQTINMGSGNIDFISGAANSILYINEPNENVGIGTITPNANYQLDVVGGDARINGLTIGLGNNGVASNTALGSNALSSNTTGANNVGIGINALSSNLGGNRNIAIGEGALTNNTSGNENVGIGAVSLSNNGTGIWNTAVGYVSMASATGSFNSAFGRGALENNTGSGNSGFGQNTLPSASGDANTAIGADAGTTLTSGDFNTFVGQGANAGIATLTNATAIGSGAIVSQNNSLVLGNNANVGIGTSTPANKLEVIGDAAKFDSVIIANGAQAGYVLTAADATGAASWQPAGAGSGWTLTGNSGTVDGTNFIGTTDNVPLTFRANNLQAGRIETGTPFNTFYGYRSGENTGIAQGNAGFGYHALLNNATVDNSAFGYQAMEQNLNGNANTAFGSRALTTNSSGDNNTAAGALAMANATGSDNAGFGRDALNFSSGGNNTAVGAWSGVFNSTGSNNVFIGHRAGYPFFSVPNAIETGTDNVMIGANTGLSLGVQVSNAVAIGSNARIDASNAMALGATGASRLNIGINTTIPNPNADLTLNSDDRGLQLNRVDRASLSLAASDRGMTVYDSTTNELLVWDGAAWISATAGGASSLQSAYDGGQTINMGTGNIDFISSVANSVLYIDEGNERIGIGNASPTFKLDLSGGNLNIDGSHAFLQAGNHLLSQNSAQQRLVIGSTGGQFATGANNTLVGVSAGDVLTSGTDNTIMGYNAGSITGSGLNNTILGSNAGVNSFNTSNNTFIGEQAGALNSSGQNNTMVGRNTGVSSVTSNSITLLGAGSDAADGINNATAIGAGAVVGASNSLVLGNGASNVGIGTQTPANKLEVIGDAAKFDSVIIVNGAQVGYVLTAADATGAASWQPLGAGTFWDLTGNAGTVDGTNFIGTTDAVAVNVRMNNQPSGRIDDATSGYTGFGFQTGNNGVGFNNAAFGYRALASNTADGNTAVGALAMENNAATNANTGVGYAALRDIQGVQNTAVGNAAMEGSTTGNNNVAVGYSALLSTDADGNTAIGSGAMRLSNTGINNVAVGFNSLVNTTADANTAVGSGALSITDLGSGNTAVGERSMTNNVDGTQNTAVGLTSLFSNDDGSQNVGVGFDALFSNTNGSNNVGVGWRAGFSLDGGNNNVFIGYDADAGVANILNSTAIGYNAVVSQDNSLVLGDTGNISVGIGTSAPQGDFHIADDFVTMRLQSTRTNTLASYEIQFGRTDGVGNFVQTGSIGTPGSGDYFQMFSPNNLHFNAGFSDRLIIGNSGTITLPDFAGGGRRLLSVNNSGVLGSINLSDSLDWARNGNDIYNTNSGNVGIGTSTPSQTLHVASEGLGAQSNMILEGHSVSSTRGPGIDIRRSRGSILTPSIVSNGDFLGAVNFYGYGNAFRESANITVLADGAISGTSVPGRLAFSTTNAGFGFASEKMTILSNGNVGIGTTTPNEKLSVNEGNIYIGRSDGNDLFVEMNGDNNGVSWAMGVDDSQDADFVISNSNDLNNPMLYLGGGGGGFNGDMGLGIKNPGVEFYQPTNLSVNPKTFTISSNGNVFADNRAAVLELHGSSADNGDEIGAINFTNQHTNNIDYNFARISAHRENTNPTISSLRFYTRNLATMTEAMVINANGNVGIGTNSPVYKLSVNGPANLNEGIASGAALRVNGAEALWYNGTYFSWGFGATANFFADPIGIGTPTPSSTLDVVGNTELNGNVTISGEVNRTSTGAANMVPIAYGTINSTGAILTSSGNVSCVRTGAGSYTITITGESYLFSGYITTATRVGSIGDIYTSSVSGNMLVRTYNTADALSDAIFSFVVYQP